jgi:hypothetical protein
MGCALLLFRRLQLLQLVLLQRQRQLLELLRLLLEQLRLLPERLHRLALQLLVQQERPRTLVRKPARRLP